METFLDAEIGNGRRYDEVGGLAAFSSIGLSG